jgi:hypothetical protein
MKSIDIRIYELFNDIPDDEPRKAEFLKRYDDFRRLTDTN